MDKLDLETIKTLITFGSLILSGILALSNNRLQAKLDNQKFRFTRIYEKQFEEVLNFWKLLSKFALDIDTIITNLGKFYYSDIDNFSSDRSTFFSLMDDYMTRNEEFLEVATSYIDYMFFIPKRIHLIFIKYMMAWKKMLFILKEEIHKLPSITPENIEALNEINITYTNFIKIIINGHIDSLKIYNEIREALFEYYKLD